MKITCKQFEELIPFYLNDELSENLKNAFVEHLHNCPNCHIKFNMLNSIVNDLKDAYNQLIFESSCDDEKVIDIIEEEEETQELHELNTNLSAYIDNELNDDINVQIRRNIISKPALRKKIEKLYNIRKLMTDSFNDEKNKLRTDFSKDIVKKIQAKPNQTENFNQCFIFIGVVISIVMVSFIILKSLL